MNKEQVANYRKDTPGIPHRIHFNNAGAALPPAIVIDTVTEYLQEEALIGGYEMAALKKPVIDTAYQSLAELLNTNVQNVAFANNATDAYNRALSSIPFEKGDIILTTYNDYVSNFIAFLQLKKLFGVQINIAENNAQGVVDLDAISQQIKNNRPKLVAVTHIPTSSGLIQDVVGIGQLCAAQDVLYLVDACQSVGQLPIDVQEIHCDFLSATGRKFLRGPRGTGFLYVSDKVLAANYEPIFLDLHSAEWTGPSSYRPASTAQRFELWERNYALILGLKAAIDYALDIGLYQIETRVQSLSKELRSRLQGLNGISPINFDTALSGIVTAKVDDWEAIDWLKALRGQKINTSLIYKEGARLDLEAQSMDWVSRISVHYYNTVEEIDHVDSVLKHLL